MRPLAQTYNATEVPKDFAHKFDDAWAGCNHPKPATMVTKTNAMQAYMAVVIANLRGVPGDVVEAGVWRGGVSCMMATASVHYPPPPGVERRSFLVDTFEGLPEPTKEDGEGAISLWKQVTSGMKTWADIGGGTRDKKLNWGGSVDEVARVMSRSKFPSSRIRYLQGKAEETLLQKSPSELPGPIAVLRLDTDWFVSTKVELEKLWPLLSPGGWLCLDDYYSWAGSRAATKEWLTITNPQWLEKAYEIGSFCNVSRGFGRNWVWKSAPYSDAEPFARPDPKWVGYIIGSNKLHHCRAGTDAASVATQKRLHDGRRI